MIIFAKNIEAAKIINTSTSPNGKWIATLFCDNSYKCYIAVKNLKAKGSKYKTAIKFSKNSKYSLRDDRKAQWLNDNKHFVIVNYVSDEDCPTVFMALYNLDTNKFEIIDDAYLLDEDIKPEKNGFSYIIIDDQIYDDKSRNKCESGITYKLRKVVRDFSGKLIKQSTYYECGGGFC